MENEVIFILCTSFYGKRDAHYWHVIRSRACEKKSMRALEKRTALEIYEVNF